MDKKPSFLWALLAGLVFAAVETVIHMMEIGGMSTALSLPDYVMFFLTGALIGIGLVYFLRRSVSRAGVRAVWIGFLIGLPFTLFGMVFGGMVGSIAVLMLSISPALFVTGVAFLIGRAFGRR
jgi:hypothetical protein